MCIETRAIAEIKALGQPPQILVDTMQLVTLIYGQLTKKWGMRNWEEETIFQDLVQFDDNGNLIKTPWNDCQMIMCVPKQFLDVLLETDWVNTISP